MSNNVFANGREISCKAASGKSICAFPDVCLSPPSPPAGPIPIPYPNTGMASDTTDGSKTVKISGKEIMLKNKSSFKKSMGDEAATKSLGMGVITAQIQGKVYFNSWSMDVKVEGQNVVRHLDLTTHNHASVPGNSTPWPYIDEMAADMIEDGACAKDNKRVKEACNDGNDPKKNKWRRTGCPPKPTKSNPSIKSDPCVKARRCMLVPFRPRSGCCPGQTAHHLLPKRAFKGIAGYNQKKAPCVCAEGHSWHRSDRSVFPRAEKTHADLHDIQDHMEAKARKIATNPDQALKYKELRGQAIEAHKAVFSSPGCDPTCLEKQLDAYHQSETVGVKDDDPVRTPFMRSAEKIEAAAGDVFRQMQKTAKASGEAFQTLSGKKF